MGQLGENTAVMFPIFYDETFLDHDTGIYHPENAGRLTAIIKVLQQASWAHQLDWRSPTPITENEDRLMDAVYAIHPQKYVSAIRTASKLGGGQLDPDTVVSAKTYDVALLAVNAWLDGVDEVLHTGHPAFVLARPPGHHALTNRGMGFCIFANAAIAAHYALQQSGIQRVAILDWDVHHGNGTQAIVETNPQIFYCSLHQYPFYPGTGAADEQGHYHNVLNVPMQTGSTIAEYKPAFENQVIPFLRQAQPDVLIVSAGYDANQADPLSNIALQPEDYGFFTSACLQLTSKILFGLEGGYDYATLSQSVSATIAACLATRREAPRSTEGERRDDSRAC
jgi:acetoin utilization deacetylase AcuC-like enzyme